MKRNDIDDIEFKLNRKHYENIFNVYLDGDSNYYFNLLNKIKIPKDINDFYYNVYSAKVGDTWTSIAFNEYGDVKLWWIICLANNIINPIDMPIQGKNYKLFKRDIVDKILKELN